MARTLRHVVAARARIRMSVAERERYVRWWREESGLTPLELRRVAETIWRDTAEPGSDSDSALVGRPRSVGR